MQGLFCLKSVKFVYFAEFVIVSVFVVERRKNPKIRSAGQKT
jgi:hypothetical protein